MQAGRHCLCEISSPSQEINRFLTEPFRCKILHQLGNGSV